MDFSLQALVQQHSSQMDSAFRRLVDTILRYSKLNISLLRISSVTETSFHVSLEGRVTGTGPASATITPMTLDLCGPSGCFGKITLPAITTQAYGADVIVNNQPVDIIDKAALQAFIQPVIQNKCAVLSMRNGNTTIRALGVGPRDICYEKELELPGMEGPVVKVHAATVVRNPSQLSLSPPVASILTNKTTVINTSPGPSGTSSPELPGSDNNISIVFHVENPSPLEISFGTCSFEIQDGEGRVLAELKGRLDIRRNHFEATFQGTVDRAVTTRLAASMKEAASSTNGTGQSGKENELPEARLVGKRCVGAGWCDETVKSINVRLKNVTKLFRALGIEGGNVENPRGKEGGLTKWARRFALR
ncbi:hypothetical protein F5Y19DRAFT_411886 [Xylariaceae sp. FL1651]|nr:hypothetical protein F5Y19DRAFT_411886 [Xylariaceae sp. FL1651]